MVWPTSQGYCKDVYFGPVARCLNVTASISPTSKGFLKFVTTFMMWLWMRFWIFKKLQKTDQKLQLASWQNSGNLGYQSVLSWQGGCYSILLLVFEGSKTLPRGFVAIFFSWVLGAIVKVLAVWQLLVLGSDVSFVSANQDENKKEN